MYFGAWNSTPSSIKFAWGARRLLAPGIRGWGRDGGNSLRRIERPGETGPESGQFSNLVRGQTIQVFYLPSKVSQPPDET